MQKTKGPRKTGQETSSNVSLVADAFLRNSRFHTLGLIVDLVDVELLAALRRVIKSADGLAALRIGRESGLPYLVLAGQLALKRGGVLAIAIEGERLPWAIAAAWERITDVGETSSMWVVAVPESVRGDVEACLADLSRVESCA